MKKGQGLSFEDGRLEASVGGWGVGQAEAGKRQEATGKTKNLSLGLPRDG